MIAKFILIGEDNEAHIAIYPENDTEGAALSMFREVNDAGNDALLRVDIDLAGYK